MSPLFEPLLANVLVATLIAVVAASAGRLLGRPALAHALWFLVLLKLVTPPLIRVPVSVLVLPAEAPMAAPLMQVELAPRSDEELVPELGPGPLSDSFASTPSLSALLLAAWALGSLCILLVAWRRAARFRCCLESTERAGHATLREARAIGKELGLCRLPEIRLSRARVSPMLVARLRGALLLLPRRLFEELSEEQRRTLVAHELVHFKRRDHLVRVFEFLVRALHWWNPLALWAAHELRAAEEECVDAWVVATDPERRKDYAEALLHALDFMSGPSVSAPSLASGIAPIHSLRRRLTMIMRAQTPSRMTRLGRASVFGAALFALPALPSIEQRLPGTQPEVLVPNQGEDVDAGELAELEKKARLLRAESEELREELETAVRRKQKRKAKEIRLDLEDHVDTIRDLEKRIGRIKMSLGRRDRGRDVRELRELAKKLEELRSGARALREQLLTADRRKQKRKAREIRRDLEDHFDTIRQLEKRGELIRQALGLPIRGVDLQELRELEMKLGELRRGAAALREQLATAARKKQ
ncbi:MAG: M56 family metallopeptidase, partial [Planctomycetota bacterium]